MKSLISTLLRLTVVHWVTSVGVVLTTTAAFLFIGYLLQPSHNPYIGIIGFVLLPGLFILGLLFIPLGLYLQSRRIGGIRAALSEPQGGSSALLPLASLFLVITFVNVTLLGAAAYRGVSYMESSEFCGTTCHAVMSPQYVRYQQSPHANVDCVACHVGPGAASFIRYKIQGVRQLIGVTTNRYPRPIPPALTTLRPAQETCEHCHWPQKFNDDKLKVVHHYNDDEQSTEKITVLLMRTGTRIHKAHVGKVVEYVATDASLQTITSVSTAGKTFSTKGAPTGGAKRLMNCMDCHNRPTHHFERPEEAVDRAIFDGRLDRSRPFARKNAILALTGKQPLDQEPEIVRRIYAENVFPQMHVTWGTYPNNIGHESYPGCFRCHDGEHASATGETITQDCATCHELLAVEEQNPEILKLLPLR